MAQLEGITITGTLVPSDTRDTYPLLDIKYVKGANYTVATYDEMIAIPADRRSDNMEITVAETNKVYRYKQATNDWVIIGTAGSAGGGGGGTGGDSTNVNIDTSDLVHRSELDEFNVAEYEVKLVKIVEDGKTTINKAVADNRDQLLTVDKFDTFDINAYKAELQKLIDNTKQELAVMDRLIEVDIEQLKAEIKAAVLAELGRS